MDFLNARDFNVTLDHEEIRTWIESHGGVPALLNKEVNNGQGILAVKFNDSDESAAVISWTEFFDTFDSENLAFKYDVTGEETQEFSYNFIPREEAIAAIQENDSAQNEMPEDSVPVENLYPSAPLNENPDGPDYPGITPPEDDYNMNIQASY